MDKHQHHEELVQGLCEQLKPIFDQSQQAVYLYLDDIHKACNKNFARLLGYATPSEWAALDDVLAACVTNSSQEILVNAYQQAMKNLAGSISTIVWTKKDGNAVKTTVMLVPIAYQNHLFALHFVF